MKLLIRWLINAISLWIVTRLVTGIYARNFTTALVAALVIGLLNSTLGLFLKVITFPLTILTFGIFLIVINAFMLELAAAFIKGFAVTSWGAAFIGALLLSIVSTLLHWLVGDKRRRSDY
jgi:putative membrane protein